MLRLEREGRVVGGRGEVHLGNRDWVDRDWDEPRKFPHHYSGRMEAMEGEVVIVMVTLQITRLGG